MNHAISELTRIAECAEANAPFWEASGDSVQAELCRAVAASCREAVAVLEDR